MSKVNHDREVSNVKSAAIGGIKKKGNSGTNAQSEVQLARLGRASHL